MCISAQASLKSFFTNLVSAGLLVYLGNEKLFVVNVIVALFSIFTSFMQLIDYMMWIDLDCTKGTNKFASIIGPVINLIQPLVIFFIALMIMKFTEAGKSHLNMLYKNSKKDYLTESVSYGSNKFNVPKVLSLVYVVVISLGLYKHYSSVISDPSKLCTKVNNGTLTWAWLNQKDFPLVLFYVPVALFNIIAINPSHPYLYIVGLIYFVMLVISYIIESKRAGELWCFTSNSIPLILLIIQRLFKSKLDKY